MIAAFGGREEQNKGEYIKSDSKQQKIVKNCKRQQKTSKSHNNKQKMQAERNHIRNKQRSIMPKPKPHRNTPKHPKTTAFYPILE